MEVPIANRFSFNHAMAMFSSNNRTQTQHFLRKTIRHGFVVFHFRLHDKLLIRFGVKFLFHLHAINPLLLRCGAAALYEY